MAKQPISVTLSDANLVWLRGRAAASGRRSVSDLLDAIVSDARTGGGATAGVRSVVGTLDLPDDDPGLARADEYITALFQASVQRPPLVPERAESGAPPRRTRRRRARG